MPERGKVLGEHEGAMKIYLGGKMNGHDRTGNWRSKIVDLIRAEGNFGDEFSDGKGIDLYGNCGLGEPPESWPTLRNAIFGKHDYVGPYLVACDHGCYHSGDHATSIGWQEYSTEDREGIRRKILDLCLEALSKADISFFWIDSLDAYGTFAEILFLSTMFFNIDAQAASEGKPRSGKHFFVASPSFAAIDEMWLGLNLVSANTKFIEKPTPREALLSALTLINDDSIEYSPIEKMFIEKWRTVYGDGISPQYNVPKFRYRVDFAFPDDKVAVELDGYEYHTSKEQFTNDRKRQREMELGGWRFIRFSGSEVYNNANACVQQAYEFWQNLKQKERA